MTIHDTFTRRLGRLLLVAAALLPAAPAEAALRVFACEPEWAALVQELGGDEVAASSATTAQQDPHRIEARPGLVARMRRADLVVCTGADLEAGWLPLLLEQSGNAAVQPGQPGHFMAARFVALREVPERLDRADGDVHAFGNPHIQTDPRNIAQVAVALGARLRELAPGRAAYLEERQRRFDQRWQAAIAQWERRARPLRGVRVVSQHRAFSYLYDWLGLEEVTVLEPKPGVDPSVAHLRRVVATLAAQPPAMVLRAAYQDPRPSNWLESEHGIRAVTLPFTVGGTREATDLFALFDATIALLLSSSAQAAR